MKKQPELTALTRNNLVNAYFELSAMGEKVTVGAVSNLAGYNRCTFYRYFTDTEHLLAEIETEICDAFKEAIPRDSLAINPLIIIDSLVEIYQKYGNYLSVLLGKYGDPRFVTRVKGIIQPVALQLISATSDSPIVTELKIEFALSAVLATVTKWYDMNRPITTTKLGAVIKEILQQGILNPDLL